MYTPFGASDLCVSDILPYNNKKKIAARVPCTDFLKVVYYPLIQQKSL